MWPGPPSGIGRAWDSLRLRSQRDADEYVDEMRARRGSPRGTWREIAIVATLFVTILIVGAIVRALM